MQTYKLQLSPTQEYYTEPILQKEDWLKILSVVEKKHPRQYETLLMFLRQPEHKSSCIALSKEYSVSFESINSLVMNFGKFVIKETGSWFRIEQNEGTEDTFWPVAMSGRNVKKTFEWKLRPELADALQEYLLEKLLDQYEDRILSGGLDNDTTKELYKWRLITDCKDMSTEEILHTLCKTNIIDNQYDGAAIKKLLVSDKDELVNAFGHLRENDWESAYADFKKAADDLTAGKFKYKISDERMAADFATCCSPDRNTFYKSDLYSTFCSYLGIEKKPAGEKYYHYISLLPLVVERENLRAPLIDKLRQETEGMIWSELLNAQDVLWQMQEFMLNSISKNWLQKLYDNAISSEHWVYSKWYPQYKNSISRFAGLFEDGKTAEDADDSTIEYLIRTPENYISSNIQGCYTYDEYAEIKKQWSTIYSILHRNILEGKITREDYDALANLLRSLTSKNKHAAHHRIWAGVFSGYISTVIKSDKFFNTYQLVRAVDESLPPSTGKWLEDNVALLEYLKTKVVFKEPEHISLFPWYLYEELNKQETSTSTTDMDKYINLLLSNHNLILTGAPGTGKTYLAKQIAKTMGAEYKLVQFHPSYDYTDFVEGLRPSKDLSFERRDGAFKDFCKRAILRDGIVEKVFYSLIGDISAGKWGYETEGKRLAVENGAIVVWDKKLDEKDKKKGFSKELLTLVATELFKKSGNDVIADCTKDGIKNVYGSEVDRLAVPIIKEICSRSLSMPYVFIIDEINRGELSKIFGELFYAIDPGYRGLDEDGKPKGLVQTQYQNMVGSEDVFHDGFYIPDNVYILGTMNDIDRGVESMDFAIRRRFAWMEVTAEERSSMLDDKKWAEQAKASMIALNKAIESNEVGLSSAYHIGPSYYLKLDQYDGDFEALWEYHIKGLLFEYLRGGRNIDHIINEILKPAFDTYKNVNA